ncbi:hypothetical protein AcW1_010079 [Taiwanofungus camphoratus]|nr:hypothetical protein AcW1_010079 [Antrodia cinnamomea]
MSVCRALKPQPARPIGNRVRLATADTNQVAPPASQCRRPLGGFVASSCSPHALSTGSSHDTGALRIDTLLARIRRGDTVSWLAQHVSDARRGEYMGKTRWYISEKILHDLPRNRSRKMI